MEQLTDRLVRTLPFANGERGQYIKRDTLAGFFVVVGRRAKTFTIQTDVHGLGERKTVRRMLGRFPDIKCDEARAKAKLVLGQFQTGERKLGAAPDVTLRAAWAEYRHDMVVKGRSMRTIALYDDTVTRVLQDWLDVPFAELGEPDNRKFVRAKHKQLTQRHGPYAANRALETLRAIYNHASRIFPLPPNPCVAVTYNKESRRERANSRRSRPESIVRARCREPDVSHRGGPRRAEVEALTPTLAAAPVAPITLLRATDRRPSVTYLSSQPKETVMAAFVVHGAKSSTQKNAALVSAADANAALAAARALGVDTLYATAVQVQAGNLSTPDVAFYGETIGAPGNGTWPALDRGA
jgi:hypothetical protein